MAAIKANPNTAVRRILTREGAGCDTFGMGELELAVRAGVPPEHLAVNGTAKSREVIARAVELGCHVILDSPAELPVCIEEARNAGRVLDVMLRVKPWLGDLDLPSDFYPQRTIREMTQTVKYGIPTSEMLPMVPEIAASEWLDLVGVHAHSGRHSSGTEFWRSLIAAEVDLIAQIRDLHGSGWAPKVVSFGGGMPAHMDRESRVPVTDPDHPTMDELAEVITGTFRERMNHYGMETTGITIEVEPGRSLHNESGVHLSRVAVIKQETTNIDRKWVELDTSEVFLSIGSLNVEPPFDYLLANKAGRDADEKVDITGLTCNYECLVEQADLPAPEVGDVVAFLNTGSYIEVYTCNFNALPRPGMVLVSGSTAEWIKKPETLDQVFGRDVVPDRLG
jgi:diaminopimelate decarboxylase